MQARKAQSKVTAFTSNGSCVKTGSGFRSCVFRFLFDEGPFLATLVRTIIINY